MEKIDLKGEWKLILDPNKTGKDKKYYENCDYPDTLNLPGTISQQKKSPKTDERSIGYLTDPYKYEGWAWIEKTVDLSAYSSLTDDSSISIILERTRITELWINGKYIGKCDTLNGKHVYSVKNDIFSDLTNVKITLLLSNVDYLTKGGHMTSPDTQTNWLGITGEISFLIEDKVRLNDTKIKTVVSEDNVILKICTTLLGIKEAACNFSITNLLNENKVLSEGKNTIEFTMPKETKLWSDTDPNLYELKIDFDKNISKWNCTYDIGFRTFTTKANHFENNGKPVFLRGKHDGMIFPETGFAPTDVSSWLKVMKTARNYGINHYRFHTCCPPEAAFIAADRLGIYMSPELPFWGTIQAPEEEGFNEIEQNYLINEGFEILNNFGNHPSFVMMSMGNELWGSEARLDSIMKQYHDYDDRHLYTGGSNNFQFWPRTTEYEDYFVGVRFAKDALIRGSYAQCDAPLGFVQTDIPNTNHDYDIFFTEGQTSDKNTVESEIEIQYGTGVKKVKATGENSHFIPNKPCISHEVGQYCMYPNFKENQRFTGVLKPYNFEEFKNRLDNSEMKDQADDFFRDSSRLAVQCYKTEIEAALRSNELSGFQLLDIQDFTGQGTAVVGVLNAFMESKGIVTGEQWRSFCDEAVLLASFDKFVWKNGEELSADIILHNYSEHNFENSFVTAYIIDTETDEILCEEQFDIIKNKRGNQKLGTFKYQFEEINEYKKFALLLIYNEGKELLNSYTLHVYPEIDSNINNILNELKEKDSTVYKNILLTKKCTDISEKKSKFDKIIYFKTDFTNEKTVSGTYCTDFWCYPMFRSISESMKKEVPVGTLGLTIDTKSPLLKNFPTDSYTTPKWYNIITHSTCVNLEGKSIKPALQMIDNFERNWKLGILYEENGVITCTSRLWEISDEPEVVYFLKNLLY